jgi:NDP-sugar pyrophosphorylase family protein
MNANPITGLSDEDPAAWQRTMQRHTLQHLPLINAEGCVVSLVRYEPPREPERSNEIILMAGGLGTRLRPLTNDVPKPLLRIGSKPILETIVENFVAHGFHRFHFCINYKADMIRRYFGDGAQWGAQIDYIEENKRLGTAGALGLLNNRPDEPFFVMNGDVLTKVDFVRLLDFHNKQGFDASMCVREYNYQVPYGVVDLDGHRLRGLQEKPVHHYFVNAGIYVLNPGTLDLVPRDEYLDMPTLFQHLIDRNGTVGSFPLREYWIDIGQMDQFEKAHDDFSEQFG